MRISIGQLKTLIREGAENDGWYHLSINDLGPTFRFTPRRPRSPYVDRDDMVIEDQHTERTSWAPSIAMALQAIEAERSRIKKYYVYFTPSLPGEIDLQDTFDDCPSNPGNEYGPEFMLKPWKRWVKSTTGRDLTFDDAEDDLATCVPDAPQTGEHWATGPVTATRLGYLSSGKLVRD